jgi:2-haloacid dehalogenase
MIDLERFTHLSFDCYGTLVDWESGILDALGPLFARHGVTLDETEVLRRYAEFEAAEEAGPYRRYRQILRAVVASFGRSCGFSPSNRDLDTLADSVGTWPPFADSADALRRLKSRYRLAALSNIDDEMLRESSRRLGDPFDEIFTAEQIGSYKPAQANFDHLLEQLETPRDRLLHVAQSLFHDHVPAKRMGLATAWINRPSRVPGVGVAPPAEASPDLEFEDLAGLADLAGL